MYYGPGYYYFDPTYVLVLLGMVLCLGASAYVNSTMRKYKREKLASGLTGAEAAKRILYEEGLYGVQVECLDSDSGDHYDPRTNTVRLSYSVYNTASVTAVAVAAHECGHALQHEEEYVFLNIRSALVPVVNIASNIGMPMIILGVILSWNQVLIQIGIMAFLLAVVFQLVTLPVEFNASGRALRKLNQYGLLNSAQILDARKVLVAAALTYVAAAASSILQLLRLYLLFGGNRRRRD